MTRCVLLFVAGVFVVPAGLLLYGWWALRGPHETMTAFDMD